MNKHDYVNRNAGDVVKAREAVECAADRIQTARRDFLKLFGYGTAGLMMGGMALPQFATANNRRATGPERRAGSPYENEFQFAPGLLYMNIGTTGASPSRVVDNFYADYDDDASNPAAYFFGQQAMRNSIAPGFGCDPYELVLSFNTTDGLWRIIMGIPFQPGDEIITTNMEEDAGISAVNILRDRFGVKVKTVNLPTNDAYSDEEVLERFKAQYKKGKTKAILFSSPIYLTGARLPAKELCLWAAGHGIISIVDGAHLPGMCNINLHDMGCDFFSGAGHKWQCGPGQTGFLYIRNGNYPDDRILQRPTSDFAPFGVPSPTDSIPVTGYTNTGPLPTYYPTNTLLYGAAGILANGERDPNPWDPTHNIAAILQLVGNGSRPAQKALTECCEMWDNWGRQNIEDYIVSLAQYLRTRIAEIWGLQSLSVPYTAEAEPVARTGLTSFNPFSLGYDYNADLSPVSFRDPGDPDDPGDPAHSAPDQSSASAAAVARLRSEFNIVIRNNSVPHSLRNNPSLNAEPGTYSSPLRVSTHLFHSVDDVDRLIDALLEVVPHPEP